MLLLLRQYCQELTAAIRSRTAREAGIVMTGNMGSAMLRFAVMLWLAALLSPADNGYLAVFVVVMDTAAIVSEGGLHPTMVRFMSARPHEPAEPLLKRCMRIKLGLVTACIVLLFACRSMYLESQGVADTYIWAYTLAGAAGIALSFNTFTMAVAQARERFAAFSTVAVSTNVIRLAAIAVLTLAGVRAASPHFAAFFVAPALAAVAALSATPFLNRVSGDTAGSPSHTGAVLQFMAPLAMLQILSIALGRLDFVMLQAITGDPEVLGNYSVAFQIAFALPLMAQALFTVLLPKVSSMRTAAELRRYRATVLRLMPVVLLVTAAGAWIAPYIITMLFRDKYAAALPVVRLLIIGHGINLIVNPLGLIFYAIKRMYYVVVMHFLQLVVFVACNWLLIPRYEGAGAAISSIVFRVLGILFMFALSGHILHRRAIQEGLS